MAAAVRFIETCPRDISVARECLTRLQRAAEARGDTAGSRAYAFGIRIVDDGLRGGIYTTEKLAPECYVALERALRRGIRQWTVFTESGKRIDCDLDEDPSVFWPDVLGAIGTFSKDWKVVVGGAAIASLGQLL